MECVDTPLACLMESSKMDILQGTLDLARRTEEVSCQVYANSFVDSGERSGAVHKIPRWSGRFSRISNSLPMTCSGAATHATTRCARRASIMEVLLRPWMRCGINAGCRGWTISAATFV